MSRDEAIDILANCIDDYVISSYCLHDCKDQQQCENMDCIFHQAIETILDLYQQEKEKNKELSEKLTEQICNKIEVEVFEEYRLKLKNSISKDKIRTKIEQIEDAIEPWGDEDLCYQLKIKDKAQIEVLKELLEEE